MRFASTIRGWWWLSCLSACLGQERAAPAAERASPAQAPVRSGWHVTLDPDTGEPAREALEEPLDDAPGAAGARRAASVVEEVSPHGGRLVRLGGRFQAHSHVELDGATKVQRCEGTP